MYSYQNTNYLRPTLMNSKVTVTLTTETSHESLQCMIVFTFYTPHHGICYLDLYNACCIVLALIAVFFYYLYCI